MNENNPVLAQLEVEDQALEVVVTHINEAGIGLRETEPHELSLKKDMPVKISLPALESNATDTLSGVIKGVMAKKVGEGKIRSLEVAFTSLTEENKGSVAAFIPVLEHMQVENAPMVKAQVEESAIENVALDEYVRLAESTAFTEEQKTEILAAANDAERDILVNAAQQGDLGQLVALKMKLKFEEDLFQRHFSSSESYVIRVAEITDENSQHVMGWLSAVDRSTLSADEVERFNTLAQSVHALYDSQKEYARTCKEMLKDGKIKDLPAPKVAPKPKEPDKREATLKELGLDDASTRRTKLIAASILLVIGLLALGYVYFGDMMAAKMLDSAAAAEAIKAQLPVENVVQDGFELVITVDVGQMNLDGRNGALDKVSSALSIAQQNKFKGIRVVSRDGEPLFLTAHSAKGAKIFRVPGT